MSQTIQDQPQVQRKPNRLIREKSPYLLQHAYNPVDWFPWGEEAFKKAREEDKPIFLSIGYSTCYWCHVMEREVFENQDIADLMNEALVCIKVDREERPDLDRVYMSAVQALTGSGGWPMSVFLTHDLKPFFGGTYFPPEPTPGRAGFPQLVKRISELWHHDRDKLIESSDQVTDYVRKALTFSGSQVLGDSVIAKAYEEIAASYDTTYAGFGGGPKFPRPVTFNFLLRYYERTDQQSALHMTLATLRAMARGGMYDHIGGGFHRYSVDEQWRVPHFEKMLYDQAQLATSYLEAYQTTHDDFYSYVARDVLDYVLRAMTHPEGGFYSAEDAESASSFDRLDEKEEGTFYLWTANEIEHLFGKDTADIFNYYYGVEENGNALSDPLGVFKGKNILYAAHTIEETASAFHRSSDDVRRLIEESRKQLFSRREQRPKPHLDDKIITAWNGLMISAFVKAFQLLDDSTYLNAAVRSARFIQSKLYVAQTHQLLRRYRDGEARFDGTLQDYAFLSSGLLDLYEASFDITWLSTALALTKRQIELFVDTTEGGFFDTQAGDSSLLIRTKEDYDGAEPTGNSIAALNLLRLAQVTDNKEWHSLAERTIKLFASRLNQRPEVLPQLLVVCERLLSTPKEIIVAGSVNANDTKQLLREIHNHFIPNKILLLADGSTGQQQLQSALPFIEGMKMINGKATAYICENYACQLPTSDTAVVSQLLTKKNATR